MGEKLPRYRLISNCDCILNIKKPLENFSEWFFFQSDLIFIKSNIRGIVMAIAVLRCRLKR